MALQDELLGLEIQEIVNLYINRKRITEFKYAFYILVLTMIEWLHKTLKNKSRCRIFYIPLYTRSSIELCGL